MRPHKLFYTALLGIVLSGGSFSACSNDPDLTSHVTEAKLMKDVTLNVPSSLPLAVGMTKKVVATVPNMDEVLIKTCTWSSETPDVASVDQEGNIKALKTGTAKISYTQDGSMGALATVTVTVQNKVDNITLENKEIWEGTSEQLIPVLTPADAYNVMEWSSSDNTIATVDAKGTVKGLQPGTVTITAKSTDGTNKTASAQLTVKHAVAIENVQLTEPGYALRPGDMAQIECKLEPNEANVQLLNWTSSDDKIAKVDVNGKVTAIANGTATITATDKITGQKSAKVQVTVAPVASWTIANYSSWNELESMGWSLRTSGKAEIRNGGLHVNTVESGGKWRNDVYFINAKHPLTLDPQTYRYLAIAMQAPGVKGKRSIKLDHKGPNSSGDYGAEPTSWVEGKSQVACWDLLSKGKNPSGKLEVFGLKMADIKVEPHDYTIYWIRTFKSMDELNAYVQKYYKK